MLSYKAVVLAVAYFTCCCTAFPIKREVPQEHSHEPIITSVRASLNVNNPDKITDPIFALLGDAAAAGGAGDVTDLACLQQVVADQAFTNAKAANDVNGMVNALIFRAIERNTGKVGLASALCTQTAKNPEIQALTQHQDPASTGAAATNKGITLALAKQIATVGGNPQDALKSGTFAPGNLSDNTGKGNTCDDANDPNGCIFTQNLLVPDATAAEISAAAAGVAVASASAAPAASSSASAVAAATTSANVAVAATASASVCPAPVTVTVTASATATAVATTAAAAQSAVVTSAAAATTAAAATSTAAASSAANQQTFTGALGGITAPAVTVGGRGFQTDNADFVNLAAALGRSCDVQHNLCANKANSGGGFAVGACDTQDTQCKALIA